MEYTEQGCAYVCMNLHCMPYRPASELASNYACCQSRIRHSRPVSEKVPQPSPIEGSSASTFGDPELCNDWIGALEKAALDS